MFSAAEFVYIIRLVAAAICGALIGYERKNRSKAAGIRTHCVVACASALMMILSKYAYLDVMEVYEGFMKIDPSRVASGVVSGIGFLGAGMIFVNKQTVTGLTTAAGVWATSGIGMTIGAGMYIVGGTATLIILFIQIILHMTPKLFAAQNKKEDKKMADSSLDSLLHGEIIDICPLEMVYNNDKTVYTITIALPNSGISGKDDESDCNKASVLDKI